MGGIIVEFHYQVLSIIYERNSNNIDSILIRKFCLVDSIQLLTQKLKTCSRLYCCFLGKNTFLGLCSWFTLEFKSFRSSIQSSYFSWQSKIFWKIFSWYRNWKSYVTFQLSVQTGLFLAVLKISAILRVFFWCFH